METLEAVELVLGWINREIEKVQMGGSYANGGRISRLKEMRDTLMAASTEESQRDLLDHWIGIDRLPRDLLDE